MGTPGTNLGHLAGLVLLLGSIGALDARVLGAGRGVSLAALSRWLTPVAIAGLLLEIATGALLFAPDATALVHSKIFIAKMALMVELGGQTGISTPTRTPNWTFRAAIAFMAA